MLRGCCHTKIVAKLITPLKFCTIDFFTGFAPYDQAQIALSFRVCYHGAKTEVFDPKHGRSDGRSLLRVTDVETCGEAASSFSTGALQESPDWDVCCCVTV